MVLGLGKQILDHGDFVRNFEAPPRIGDEGAVGVIEGFAEEFNFFFNQEADAAVARAEFFRSAVRGGVLAVGGAESIIDIQIAEFWRELGGEIGLVFFFFFCGSGYSPAGRRRHFSSRRRLFRPGGRCNRRPASRVYAAAC